MLVNKKNRDQHKFHEPFMIEALRMAQKAFQYNEVPVGAIIVKDKQIIGSGFNKVIRNNSSLFHAEMIAIYQAAQFLNNYRLTGAQLYSTLEPCHMCAKAMVDARIDSLFFGAMEPKSGAVQSVDHFFDQNYLNHKVEYSGGHGAESSAALLRKFFLTRRN
ncbi:nucleoside deaminase [Gammaproteobacteria bacterium]|nr:nucleoside deaminase [Gammaproteobacteria bacterium]